MKSTIVLGLRQGIVIKQLFAYYRTGKDILYFPRIDRDQIAMNI